MKHPFYSIFVFCLCYLPHLAAGQFYEWGHAFNSKDPIFSSTLTLAASTVDQTGAVYNFGYLDRQSRDIDPGPGTYLVGGRYAGGKDGFNFIQKLDKNGNFLWGGQFGPQSNSWDLISIETATSDLHNQVYMAGLIRRTTGSYDMDIDTGAADTLFIDAADGAVFVSKVDPQGDMEWVVNFAPYDKIYNQGIFNGLSVSAIKTDQKENVYITGHFSSINSSSLETSTYFSDNVDFDPGPGTAYLASDGNQDGFLVKLDKNGTFQWAINLGGSAGVEYDKGDREWSVQARATDVFNDVVVDDSGNVLVTGLITTNSGEKVDMDPGTAPSDTFFIQQGGAFVLKLDSNAHFKWSKVVNGSATVISGNHIFLNNQNDIFVSGDFNNTVDFDPDTSTQNISSNGTTQTFFLKLSAAGDYRWVRTWGINSIGSLTRQGSDGSFYFAGNHPTGTAVDYDPGPSTQELIGNSTSSSPVTTYVSRFLSDGSFDWVRPLEGAGYSLADISIGPDESMHFSGHGIDSLDANPLPLDTSILNLDDGLGNGLFTFKWSLTQCDLSTETYGNLSASSCDVFISPSGKTFTSSGTYNDTIFNKAGCDSIITMDVTIKKSTYDTVYASVCNSYFVPQTFEEFNRTGTYQYTLTNSLGCDSIVTLNLTVLTSYTSFFASACGSYVSPSGNYEWDTSGIYRDTIQGTTGCDSIIVIALEIIPNSFDTISINSCLEYTSPSGQYTWTQSGQYTDTLLNHLGCDSVLVINLVITPIDVNLSATDKDGTIIARALEKYATSYQWLDCSNNYSPINNATDTFYQLEPSDNIAVAISKNGCVDTSDCVNPTSLTKVSVYDPIQYTSFKVYPNPVGEQLYVEAEIPIQRIQVTNISGQVFFTQHYTTEKSTQLLFPELTAGYYLLTIQTEKGHAHYPIVKQ